MGTTFRSALTWGIPATVVDLIPSVPKLFPYYHSDAAQVVALPGARIISDDGRRFLERTSQTFDSIIVDPPPPVPAAGSSLLYSKEFYALVKEHLREGGIFHQWLPEGDRATEAAVARSLRAPVSPEWNTCASVCIRDSANSCTLAQSSPAANGNCIVIGGGVKPRPAGLGYKPPLNC